MGAIIAGSRNGSIIKEINRLQVVSLVVNNTCNLKCRHCYMQTGKTLIPVLREDEWKSLAKSLFTDIHPSILSFVGKEPLLNSQSAKLVSDIIHLRNIIQPAKHNQTEIGLLTNGMSLQRFSDNLLDNPPDYIDISVDGLPAEHDLLRGEGVFSQLEPNLRWATKYFHGPIWLTPTLNRKNIYSFLPMISYYNSHFGIKRFAFGFYRSGNGLDNEYAILTSQVEKLLNKDLYELDKFKINGDLEIIFDLDQYHPEIFQKFIDAGWASSKGRIETYTYPLSNGITIKTHVTPKPVGLRYSVRITPDGYWLAAEDVMRLNEYKNLAIANVRDFNFDTVELYKAGIHSSRFKALYNQSSCLQTNGILSSNSFIGGQNFATI